MAWLLLRPAGGAAVEANLRDGGGCGGGLSDDVETAEETSIANLEFGQKTGDRRPIG